jgi:hypothetical protein
MASGVDAPAGVASSATSSAAEAAVDPFEFLEPVEVLANVLHIAFFLILRVQIPASFAEDIEAAKWSTRKEALEVWVFLSCITADAPGRSQAG